MQIFKINENLQIVAEGFSTSRSWGHKATAMYNSTAIQYEVCSTKITYYNRTWERYTFESILYKIVDIMDKEKRVPLKDRIEASRFIKNYR
jgi:hypothetical protein